MKRNLFIFIIFLLSISFTSGYSKGTIKDKDSFSTYIGLSESEIKKIAPLFVEMNEEYYMVDMALSDTYLAVLYVEINDEGVVDSVNYGFLSSEKINEKNQFLSALRIFGIDYYRSDTKYDVFEEPGLLYIKTDDYFCYGMRDEDSVEQYEDFSDAYVSTCTVDDNIYNLLALRYLIRMAIESDSEESSAEINSDGTWTCENGHSGNKGKFCTQCGAPKPISPESIPSEEESKPTEKELGEMFRRGVAYDFGDGVEKDPAQAVYWYRKAAEYGHAKAAYYLGISYDEGTGVEENGTQAVYWYRKAAELGVDGAQFNLARKYEIGKGVEQNYKQAVYWYRKAAEQGFSDAQTNLGYAYLHGEGVEQDLDQALYWTQKAADQGNEIAIKNLLIIKNKIEKVNQPTATPKPSNNSSNNYRYKIYNKNDIGTVMRIKPMLDSEVVCTVKNGTMIKLRSSYEYTKDGYIWRYIQTETGLSGYVNDAHIIENR